MFIVKNALLSITRNKGRNILIGAIILVIAAACTVTLAIQNTAKDLISSYENAYDKEVTISFDRSSMMKDFDMRDRDAMEDAKDRFAAIETYTVDDVENFAESEHIEDYRYTYTISLNGSNIDKAETETKNPFGGDGGKGGERLDNDNTLDFTLTGYSDISAMSEFIDGTYTMSEIADDAWEVAFDGNNVFINQELADYNDLAVGDKIKLNDDNGKTYEFKIIGIFADNEQATGPMSMFSNSVNTLITNAAALVKIDNSNDNINGTINPTFIIDAYENVEATQADFYERGLDETYILQTNEETASAAVTSVQNVKSFAMTFFVVVLIIGAVILFTINMITIRERKYEIGVFRTIGMSKIKLTGQFMCELAIVAFVALLVGAGVGALTAKPVSNALLASEIESSTEKTSEMANNFGGGMRGDNRGETETKGGAPDMSKIRAVGTVQAYDSIDAVVSGTVLAQLLAVGLALVLISGSVAMISIQRFSPLTILKERS